MSFIIVRRLHIIISLLFLCNLNLLAFSDADACAIAGRFYQCLQTIAEEKYTSNGENSDATYNAKQTALSLCYTRSINMPNEFYQFGFSIEDAFLEAGTYISYLRQFAINKHDVKYRPQIINVKSYQEIRAVKSENSTNFYSVYVKKTISTGGVSKEFLDTLLVCVEGNEGKIARITNLTNTFASGESAVSLRGKAAELFSQKKYQEAYDTYLKVIRKDYKQGDAYYRLGLMAYHNLGCKDRFRNKSARLKQAYDYIVLAEEHGNSEIKEYASRVKYYMENGF